MNNFYGAVMYMQHDMQKMVFEEFPPIIEAYMRNAKKPKEDQSPYFLTWHHQIAYLLKQWTAKHFEEVHSTLVMSEEMLLRKDSESLKQHQIERMAQMIGMEMLKNGGVIKDEYTLRDYQPGMELKLSALVLKNPKHKEVIDENSI